MTYNGSAQAPCSATVTGAGGLSLTPTPSYSNNTNAGTATASYTYAGDTNHTGSSDSKNFTIDRADPDCSVTGYDVTYNANPHTASGSCKGVGGGELSGLDLSGTTHTDAGDYPNDPWSFAQTTNYNAASGTVHDHIDRADPDCSVTGYDVTYNANPHTASGSCKGVGGGELSGLDLSGTTHTDAGDYPNDPWSFAQTTNYNAASAPSMTTSTAPTRTLRSRATT